MKLGEKHVWVVATRRFREERYVYDKYKYVCIKQ